MFKNNLFIIQANIAGADKKITKEKIEFLENIINEIEKNLPPIKVFYPWRDRTLRFV